MLPLQIFKCPNTARPAGLRQVVLLQLTALLLVLAAPAAVRAQAAAEPDTAPGPQPPLTPLLQQLTAREFSQRQQAVTQLQQFAGSVNGLQQL
ncbi:MAG: hypothetical protein ACK48R_08990, partial [Planctomyces sp.]